MKAKFYNIRIHILVWALLLVIPFTLAYKFSRSFIDDHIEISLTPFIVFTVVLISIFYFNYFVLAPRFLLSRKYWKYILSLLASTFVAFSIPALFFWFSDFNPKGFHDMHEKVLIVKKISPIIRTNTFLMIAITIITSILLALNNRLKQTEEEKLAAKIASLKSQINPHFLFNTLNNIYAITISTSPKAADMIDKLAAMMRYTMKESQGDFVPLADEINYINSFIELQKIRLDRGVVLEYKEPENIPPLKISPMLLVPFIENAFKHGINPEQKSHVKIEISIDKSVLHLSVVNNKVKVQQEISERSGLGIENTKHRLNLIYPSKHLLAINDSAKEFAVSLNINLK